jgi:hypothetical protein
VDISRWARPEDRPRAASEDWEGPHAAPEDGAGSHVAPPADEAIDPRQARRRDPRASATGALARVGSLLPGDRRPKVGDTRPRRRSGEPAAPPWERPHHRYEAYPTLRTRIGLPALPRAGMLALALLLAAVGLFFLPSLLGIGNPGGSPAPSGTAPRSPVPTGSAAPSIVAAPSPQVYEVQPGDTMSRIASKFGIPLAMLVEANKAKVPNPDRLAVGDLLVIPTPVPTGFPAAEPSTSPGPSAASSPR